MVERMRNLISASYGSDAASLYGLSSDVAHKLPLIVASADAVMAEIRPDPFICTFLAPWWSQCALELSDISSFVVAGNLYLEGVKIFGADNEESFSSLLASFEGKNKGKSADWCGHIWCDFNGLIGDASLILTAMHLQSKKLLNVVADNSFPDRPFILKRGDEMIKLTYEPIYVLKPTEVASLVEGGRRHITHGRV